MRARREFPRTRLRRTFGRLGLLAGLAACSPTTSGPAPSLAERGHRVYETVCIACHNADPHRPGSLGPDVAGASRELLEAKILHGSYPPGYTPKRPSHAMPRYAHLADDLDALTAYLAGSSTGTRGRAGAARRARLTPSQAP